MGKKAKAKADRKSNFPLVFWDGLRDRAQAVADEEYNGNLTTYLNELVKKDVKRHEARK